MQQRGAGAPPRWHRRVLVTGIVVAATVLQRDRIAGILALRRLRATSDEWPAGPHGEAPQQDEIPVDPARCEPLSA